MIILFHHVISLIRHLIRENKRQKVLCEFKKIQQNISDINFAKSWAYKDAEQELRFDPPVYRQRYGTIHDILLNAKWRKDLKKIVEFGCAELGLFIFLKNLMGITEINFVDIDEVLLSENLFRVKPLTVEYLRKRSDPLTVNVFAGSITDPDKRILDADVVIGIEIIEHLYPDILEAVPYTVFHCIQPKLAIFTTPNADFNELLPNLKGFRHSDHKFEWTREQLESWSINITDRFPQYFATFHGIGCGPEGTESLGCCSQMVVFVRKDIVDPSYILPTVRCFCSGDMPCEHQYAKITKEKSNFCPSCCPMQSYGICTYFSYAKHFENLKTESPGASDAENLIFYKLLQSVDFPYEKDDRTQEEKILDELKYKINSLGYCNGRFFNVDKLRSEIPLVELMYSSFGQFITMPEVETLLSRNGYTLEECQTNEEDDEKQLCVIYEPEMEDFSSSESEASGYESGHSRFLNEASLSDWEDYGFPNEREGQKVPPNGGVFPEWLLQMLRTNFPLDGEVIPEGPHFYSQGDGLGVHPSVLAIDFNDDDEDASSESSSTNGSAGLTGNENSIQDIAPLPSDRQTASGGSRSRENNIIPCGVNSTVGNPQLTMHNEESEEFFDTTDELNNYPKKKL